MLARMVCGATAGADIGPERAGRLGLGFELGAFCATQHVQHAERGARTAWIKP